MPRFSLKGAGAGGLPGLPRTGCGSDVPPARACGLGRCLSPGTRAYQVLGISKTSGIIIDKTCDIHLGVWLSL